MAHWAQIDDDNIVVRVTVGSNDDPDEGYSWLVENIGGTWVKTSYNGNIRGRFAGVGFRYDPGLDEFIPPSPFPSWVWAGDSWQAPVAKPTEGYWDWDEDAQEWHEIPAPIPPTSST